jgi:hypothetical protein
MSVLDEKNQTDTAMDSIFCKSDRQVSLQTALSKTQLAALTFAKALQYSVLPSRVFCQHRKA